jgi:hypothetical protein
MGKRETYGCVIISPVRPSTMWRCTKHDTEARGLSALLDKCEKKAKSS